MTQRSRPFAKPSPEQLRPPCAGDSRRGDDQNARQPSAHQYLRRRQGLCRNRLTPQGVRLDDGYALKDVRTPDLTQAIRTIASGQGYLDPRVAQQTLHWIRDRSHAAFGHSLDRLTRLSPQERAILPLLAEGKTNKEIAVDLRLSDKTVKNYLANIFDKLQVRRRAEAVCWYIRTTQTPSRDSRF